MILDPRAQDLILVPVKETSIKGDQAEIPELTEL